MAIGELVALKFHAGTHEADDPSRGVKQGHAKYPNFNLISSQVRKGMDWCKFIDAHGIGMQADKSCGHKEEGDTPFGEQCIVIAVPADFAAEALTAFPTILTELTEAEFEDFYNNKAHAHEDDERIDTDALVGLKARKDLMVDQGLDVSAINTQIAKALDPNNSTEYGVRKNKSKTWADVKTNKGVSIRTKA